VGGKWEVGGRWHRPDFHLALLQVVLGAVLLLARAHGLLGRGGSLPWDRAATFLIIAQADPRPYRRCTFLCQTRPKKHRFVL